MTNNDRHYYLYAKGWYKGENLFDDLIKIHATWSEIDKDYLNINYPIERLLKLAMAHLISTDSHINFINDIRKNCLPDWFLKTNVQDINTATINACLAVLQFAKVVDIPITLGFPDYHVLPYVTKKMPSGNSSCFGI